MVADASPSRDAGVHRSSRTWAGLSTVLIVCLTVWVLRRPDQLLHPYVWAEEFKMLNELQASGFWRAATRPYEGYLLFPTSFGVSAAAAISFTYLPSLLYLGSTLWFIATIALLVVPASPLPLPYRAAAAIGLTLLPLDAEVFGVLLYSFWWTSLWPLLPLLWRTQQPVLRAAVTVVGGLSSLAGAALFLPLALVYLLRRQRADLVASLCLAGCFVVQATVYLRSERAAAALQPGAVLQQCLRTFSYFVLGWMAPSPALLLATGAALFLLMAAATAQTIRSTSANTRTMLLGLASASILLIVMSAVPAPLIAHPALAGPRYYFHGFAAIVLIALALLAWSRQRVVRGLALVVLALGAASATASFQRRSEPVDWRVALAGCMASDGPHVVAVHTTGRRTDMWLHDLKITPETCRRVHASG